jgi:hypothetical protein
MDKGYFEGVEYEWYLEDGVYVVYMSAEDKQTFEKNKVSNEKNGNY